uniref:Uncharacterized protein LOC102806071 n=1 Tax=Saccoglossus kowalevskii TaxID=10224 RepID=A0ABM0MUU1_SACKO|nr:PREDICTED: uncharacterized protein LOC102806071 [Saccoglossus kowalevskii]
MAGLSLLTRGVGAEVKQKGHKKLDVCLEPEDYLNIQSKKFYLPPIEQKVAWNEDEEGDKLEYSPRELPLHKTYLTRKGALLLFSEELALRTKRQRKSEKALEAEDYDDFEMKTIEDLRNAVLSYGMGAGGDAGEEEALYFNFLHRHRWPHQRNIRPGFSAKRYMSHWSRSWDDSILNTLRSKGYIWDKNLFQQNSLLPHLYRRINDDLSQPPMPYRINRNMLMSPGSLENYEFYKIRPGSSDSGRPSEDLHSEGRDSRVSLHGSIAAIARDEDDKARAVTYADLEKEQQQQVLQRLLVQSALHQQQQLIEESMSKLESKSNKDTVPSINEIDMEKAIDVIPSRSKSVHFAEKVPVIPEETEEELTDNEDIGEAPPLPHEDGEEDSDDSGHLSDGESYPASVGTKKSRPVSLRDIDLKGGDIDATLSFTIKSFQANQSEDEDLDSQHPLSLSQHALSGLQHALSDDEHDEGICLECTGITNQLTLNIIQSSPSSSFISYPRVFYPHHVHMVFKIFAF